MRDHRCENCRFFYLDPDFVNRTECHRRAPSLINDLLPSLRQEMEKDRSAALFHAFWPAVYRNDWCGEWQPLPANQSS